MTTILLVDKSVPDQNIITNSLNAGVTMYVNNTFVDLTAQNVARLGLMFENENDCIIPYYWGNKVPTNPPQPPKDTYKYFSK